MVEINFQVAQSWISHFPFHNSFFKMTVDVKVLPSCNLMTSFQMARHVGRCTTTIWDSVSGDFGCKEREEGGGREKLFDNETVEPLGMYRLSLLGVTACCNILGNFHAPVPPLFRPSHAHPLFRCLLPNSILHSVLMYLCFILLLSSLVSNIVAFISFLTKYLEQQEVGKLKRK